MGILSYRYGVLSDQAEQLRSQYLRACLRERQNNYKFADVQEYFPGNDGSRQFLLLAFSIDTDSAQLPDEMPSAEQYRYTYLSYVDMIFSEKFAVRCRGESFARTEDGELLLYLLMLSPAKYDLWNEHGRGLLDSICNVFMGEFSVPVICAVYQSVEYVIFCSANYYL